MKILLFAFFLINFSLMVACQPLSSAPSLPTIAFGRTEARVGVSAPFTADAVIGYKVDHHCFKEISRTYFAKNNL